MASAFFLIARVLGIGARLYLGGLIFAVIWKYLNPGHKVTLDTYLWGILIVTAATTAYTAIGGIKAVVWTDLIQACLMVGAVLVSIGLLVAKMGGLGAVANALGPNGFAELHWFQVGWDSSLGFGGALKAMLESPYTIFSAFIASTFTTMATHGTDQDMVQRLLTATDHKRSRLSLVVSGLADVPIALAFLAVGILLSLYYGSTGGPNIPASEIFAHYIVHEMPPGLRGLVIAGVLSTMMGSTSAALNALATSYTKDFHKPYVDPAADEQGLIGAAQWATVVFGVAMVGVALLVAEIALRNPEMTILPIAIGLLGYTFGSILGVFLVGMLSKGRGSDLGNVIAMVCGVLGVLVFCRILPEPLLRMVLPQEWPKIAWPWYVFVGTIITAAVSLLFETPESRQASLREQERLLDASENPDAQKD
jgi:Na+/proline symporter